MFSYLRSKEATAALFRDVAPKVADRPGGYTRIIKLGNRLGDAAELAMIEMVDFNTLYSAKEKAGAEVKRTRRSRRGKSGADGTGAEAKEEAPKATAAAPKTEKPKAAAEKPKDDAPSAGEEPKSE